MSTIGATFGAASAPSSPASTVVNEWTDEHTQQIKTYRNESGVTVGAVALTMKERKVSVSGLGQPAIALTASNSITSGTLTLTSISRDETNDDFPKFSADYMAWS